MVIADIYNHLLPLPIWYSLCFQQAPQQAPGSLPHDMTQTFIPEGSESSCLDWVVVVFN